ncbi:DUF4328 domain-containing protein [Kribbella sp. NPDC056861]|uniref:DUF4328 domain-containing protein n=1 Tax=Kribbella sp. NPDC056861 TaxID=3154857 RepID=UPI0034124B03
MSRLPRAASVLIWLATLAQVLLAVADWRDYAVYADNPQDWDWEAIRAADVIPSAATLVAAVVFIVWLRRARDTSERLSTAPHRHGRGWVIAGWLIPVISLWYPKQIVDDIITASTPANEESQADSRGIQIWWGTWVATVLLTALPLDPSNEPTTRDLLLAALNSTVTAVLTVVCAVYAVRVVQLITNLQTERPADVPAPGLQPFQH